MGELRIKTGFVYIICGILIVLCSCMVFGCTVQNKTTTDTPETKPDKPQSIYHLMEAALIGGRSTVDYSKYLFAGDEVNGRISVTGLWEVEGDYSIPWTFEAWNPDGVLLDTATISNWYMDAYYTFKFIAVANGEYTIRAIHTSIAVRDLDIEISPGGWKFAGSRVE
jgi:hypothetical protein